MPCYSPLHGYRSRALSSNGKRPVVFNPADGFLDLKVSIPCGQCIGCRLERSRQWAVRCIHEASLHTENCFITLTYDDNHLPPGGSLVLEDYQKFMKRLRKRCGKLRFFHAGEYGDKYGRPHYHAIIFGYDFPDKVIYSMRGGFPTYTSRILSELWEFGMCVIGAVTFESAAYVARYCLKKTTGKALSKPSGPDDLLPYEKIDYSTGEVYRVAPEYCTMSRRPGIASGWINKFMSDVYPADQIIVNGVPCKPPKFYDGQFELTDSKKYASIKYRRKGAAKKRKEDQTPERLYVRETVCKAKLKSKKRHEEV